MLRQHFPLCGTYWYRPVVNVYAFQELKLSKAVAIQGFTRLKLVRWSVRCCGAGSLTWRRSPWPGGLHRAGADYRHARWYQHASNEYIYLASLFALGFRSLARNC